MLTHLRLLTIKGAPDVLIGRCTSYTGSDGASHALDDTIRASFEKTKDQWSSQGMRVILLARKVFSHNDVPSISASNDLEAETMEQAKSGLTLVGLIAISDPLVSKPHVDRHLACH